MIRKIGIAALSAALVFGTAPAYACTGISLKATDGAAIRGRTRVRLPVALERARHSRGPEDERHAA
ncbi:MAG: hypothetical protein WBW73_20275 [Rhodoplanes sp.]